MKKQLVFLNLVIPLLVFVIPSRDYVTHLIGLATVIPLVLLVFNIVLYIAKREASWLKCCVLMLGGLVSAHAVVILSWSFSTGRRLTSDPEGFAISLSLAKYHAGFVAAVFVVGWLVISMIRRRQRAAHKS